MRVKISDCARCGRPAGIAGREHCARCHYALAHRPVRSQCPACGQLKKLQEATGKCVLCSRACIRCGQKIGRVGREICGLCLVKDRRAAAWQPCPRCGKPGRIREGTGWCGHCSHPGRTPSPDAACRACGLVAHLEGDGLCLPCYTKSPHRITLRAGNLAAQLSDPPSWLPGFADYLVPRHNATAASGRPPHGHVVGFVRPGQPNVAIFSQPRRTAARDPGPGRPPGSGSCDPRPPRTAAASR